MKEVRLGNTKHRFGRNIDYGIVMFYALHQLGTHVSCPTGFCGQVTIGYERSVLPRGVVSSLGS